MKIIDFQGKQIVASKIVYLSEFTVRKSGHGVTYGYFELHLTNEILYFGGNNYVSCGLDSEPTSPPNVFKLYCELLEKMKEDEDTTEDESCDGCKYDKLYKPEDCQFCSRYVMPDNYEPKEDR